jgi:hypothetical protein
MPTTAPARPDARAPRRYLLLAFLIATWSAASLSDARASSRAPARKASEASAAADTSCTRLAGRYNAWGTRDSASARLNTARSLAGLVSGLYVAQPTYVEIAFPAPDTMRITIWADTARIHVRTLSLDSPGVRCAQGVLSLPPSRFESDALIGSSRQRVELREGSGGRLIAALQVKQRGLAYLLFPYWDTFTELYEFERAK